jgi:hypothetical protein
LTSRADARLEGRSIRERTAALRIASATAFLFALAACGQNGGPAAKTANAAAAPAAIVDPGLPTSLAAWRAEVLTGCIEGGRATAPADVPVEAQCACAVDREMAGRTLAELAEAERTGANERGFEDSLRDCSAEIPAR